MAATRAKAQALIMAGKVKVEGEIARKAGVTVHRAKTIELLSAPRYVSRGGDKLEGALLDFGVSPRGFACLDVGASTGGFTDCLLQHGAKIVYAVDVGRGQLDVSLRRNPNVHVIEKTHAKDIRADQMPEPPAFVTVDVSFISLKKVLPPIKSLLEAGATVLPLLKPQFEVGPRHLKKGVVRSEETRTRCILNMTTFLKGAGFEVLGRAPSRLKGPKGNQEYFLHLKVA